MADELSELHENAERGAEHGMAWVTISMAVLAVFVAAISLMGHRMHTEEIMSETLATDTWAQYQAKSIRERSYEVFLDQLSVFTVQGAEKAASLKEKYSKEIERYHEEMKELTAKAKEYENEVEKIQKRGDRFDLAEVLMEAALVISSITLLTKKRAFWALGMVMAVLGLVVAGRAFFMN
jgi:predicted ribosome quality control (RQC) complex YloA/Tae2 family protein